MIHTAMGSIANARWINNMAVETGNICVLQGTKRMNGFTPEDTKHNFQVS